jgi:MFS family permease
MTQRPLLMGVFGAVFAVSSIVGPLLGGALSGMYLPLLARDFANSYELIDHVSWRYALVL